jgi:hypothetical protein
VTHRVANDDDLRSVLQTTSPSAREHLRHALILGDRDRDAIAYQLLRYRDENGTAWANLVDQLTLNPDLRRTFVRVLGDLEASG